MICHRHKVEFVRVPKRGTCFRTILQRCPQCVAEARAKVILEQARFAKWHPMSLYRDEVKNVQLDW